MSDCMFGVWSFVGISKPSGNQTLANSSVFRKHPLVCLKSCVDVAGNHECLKGLFQNVGWYLMVPYGTIWCHMVPYGALWYLMVPYATIVELKTKKAS